MEAELPSHIESTEHRKSLVETIDQSDHHGLFDIIAIIEDIRLKESGHVKSLGANEPS
jgi:hypothetical protein